MAQVVISEYREDLGLYFLYLAEDKNIPKDTKIVLDTFVSIVAKYLYLKFPVCQVRMMLPGEMGHLTTIAALDSNSNTMEIIERYLCA